MAKRSWRRVGVQSLALMIIWIVLSGFYDAFHLGLGVLSVILVLLMNPPVSAPGEFTTTRPRWGRVLLYLPWLGLEMVLAAVEVARVVLPPTMPLSPRLVRFRSPRLNDFARVVLGNSITLTPGTLTVDIDGDEYLVHALTESAARELEGGRMQARVAGLFAESSKDSGR
jgi:multicomponent Na+:H+ antiporter subunit E